MTTARFPTLDALSAVTGSLVSSKGVGAVYDVLNWMAGESLFTHQLPRVGGEAMRYYKKNLPEFRVTIAEADYISRENWKSYAAIWLARHGPFMEVPRLSPEDHEVIDPISEAVEVIHPRNIIVLRTDG